MFARRLAIGRAIARHALISAGIAVRHGPAGFELVSLPRSAARQDGPHDVVRASGDKNGWCRSRGVRGRR